MQGMPAGGDGRSGRIIGKKKKKIYG